VKDKSALIRTFEILPEYLKTGEGAVVNNYRDWGLQLGRRFRALKLWFVIRSFGVNGLRRKVAAHIRWAETFADWVEREEGFEILAPYPLATVCFRLKPPTLKDEEKINALNADFLERINGTEKIFLTHTKLDGKYTVRFVVGQTRTEFRHIEDAWQIIRNIGREMIRKQIT
jgi:aromatic-L-amino-acid decarboxylase